MDNDIDFVCSLCKNKIPLCGGVCRICAHRNAPYLGPYLRGNDFPQMTSRVPMTSVIPQQTSGWIHGGSTSAHDVSQGKMVADNRVPAQFYPQQSYRMDSGSPSFRGTPTARVQAAAPQQVVQPERVAPIPQTQVDAIVRGEGNSDMRSTASANLPQDNPQSLTQPTGAISEADRSHGGRAGHRGRGGRGGRGARRVSLNARGRPKVRIIDTDSDIQDRPLTEAQQRCYAASIILERDRAARGIFASFPLLTELPPGWEGRQMPWMLPGPFNEDEDN